MQFASPRNSIFSCRVPPVTAVDASQVAKTQAHLEATLRPEGKDEARRALPATGKQGAQVLAEVLSRYFAISAAAINSRPLAQVPPSILSLGYYYGSAISSGSVRTMGASIWRYSSVRDGSKEEHPGAR